MIVSWLILALSLAMVFFYFQATCQRILRQQFEREYFQSIANVIRLEFPSLRQSLEEPGVWLDYSQLPKALKCDFFALTHLLENTTNGKQRYSRQERLLILYFRMQLLSLGVRRVLRVGERRAALRLTSVLEYFANVVGQRMNTVGLANLNAVGYLGSR